MGRNLTMLPRLGSGRGEEKRSWLGTVLSLCASSLLALKGGQMFLWAEQATKPRGPLLLSSTPGSLQPPLVADSVNDVAAPEQAEEGMVIWSHLQSLASPAQGLTKPRLAAVTGCWLKRGAGTALSSLVLSDKPPALSVALEMLQSLC